MVQHIRYTLGEAEKTGISYSCFIFRVKESILYLVHKMAALNGFLLSLFPLQDGSPLIISQKWGEEKRNLPFSLDKENENGGEEKEKEKSVRDRLRTRRGRG